MKQQFLKGKTDTIRLSVYSNNVEVVPSSANITLKKPDGSTLQAQTAATVGSDGEMTYALTTTHTADHNLNYIAEWEYVVGSTTYYETQLFDVVKSILSIPITDDDLFNELESLRNVARQEAGTATSATSSTLVDTAERSEDNDFWNGGSIEILSGTGAGQFREVTDFVQSTSTITVSPDWTTTPDSTSTYLIVRSFTKKIQQAFRLLETKLYNKGRRHELIIESSQIEFPLIYLTVHHICLDLMSEEGDKWSLLAVEYEKKFDDAYKQMRVEYDANESGTITADEEHNATTTVRLSRS